MQNRHTRELISTEDTIQYNTTLLSLCKDICQQTREREVGEGGGEREGETEREGEGERERD